MDGGIQYFDIILFAMITAFLVLRLRSVLGRKTGEEPRPREREIEPVRDSNVIDMPERDAGPAEPPSDPLSQGLTQIQIADPGFDTKEFVEGASSAFEMIVHAFATGDTGTLRTLLSDDVFDNFARAIKERLGAGETLETTVIGIKSVDIIEAMMEDRMAMVTVKIVSEQVNVTRDTEGRVVDGDPNQVTDVTDIWTFSRNTRSRDPNWKLVETRSPN